MQGRVFGKMFRRAEREQSEGGGGGGGRIGNWRGFSVRRVPAKASAPVTISSFAT